MKKFITLNPVRVSPKDYEALQHALVTYFQREIYIPLVKGLPDQVRIINSNKSLVDLIKSGDIRYTGNGFTGKFNSQVSQELKDLGAKWSKTEKKFLINPAFLPSELSKALAYQLNEDSKLAAQFGKKLSEIDSIEENFNSDSLFNSFLGKFTKDFKQTVKALQLIPTLSKEARKRIAKDYSDNLNLYVKDFKDEQILKLRKQATANVFTGNRYDHLAKVIKDSFGVTQRKALFLARQETNLLSSKLKEVSYRDAGIDEYYWVSVIGTPAHPVRALHKKLNDRSKAGETFKFSDPPVSGSKGEHQNPGEPWNCRCVARPVVRLK